MHLFTLLINHSISFLKYIFHTSALFSIKFFHQLISLMVRFYDVVIVDQNQILVNNQSKQQMAPRFLFGTMKDYLAKYKTKTRQKRINFMNFLRTQRQNIIARQRQKLVKRIMFWTIFLGSSYLIYNQIYRKKVQINKMNSKLNNFYSTIMLKQSLKEDLSCITLSPKTLDQLTNIVSLAYRYHYKIIVRMDELTKREKIIISQKFDTKCLFINLSNLNKTRINEVNGTIYAEAGVSCSQVNKVLQQNGYANLFPQQLNKQTIYNAIINNLPLNNGELHSNITNMELVSAAGKNFRSASEPNRYGQIPSLNPLFIGTGGIFSIPTAVNITITKKEKSNFLEENLKIDIKDISERIGALRKFTEVNNNSFIDLKISNSLVKSPTDTNDFFITCKEKYPIFKDKIDICQQICQQKGIPATKIQQKKEAKLFNLFFSINNSIFEQFILKFSHLPYQFEKGLLKVGISLGQNHQNHEKYVSVINEITNNNGVLVWCDIPQILLRIKPSLDSSEVGAELMRKIVQIREGLDRRNILYSHSRYEDYFAKGFLRRLTQYFW